MHYPKRYGSLLLQDSVCKTMNCFIRVSDALWVGIFWNTPDTFDRWISADQFFYHVHVRPVGVIGTLIISIPKYSVIAKCLSYPGTGHKNFTLSSFAHGVLPITP